MEISDSLSLWRNCVKILFSLAGGFIDTSAASFMGNEEVREEKLIPASNNEFTTLNSLPLLVNNNDQAKVFQKDGTVPLLFFDFIMNMIKPKTNTEHRSSRRTLEARDMKMLDILMFFKACGVKLLSDVYIEPEPVTIGMNLGCVQWEKLFHELSPIIQRYMLSNLPDVYQEMRDKNFHEYIFKSTMFTVKGLEVTYRLSDRSTVNITNSKVAGVQDLAAQKANIFIVAECSEDKKHFETILSELLSLFIGNHELHKEDLIDFVQMYLAVPDKERFLKRKNIPQLDPGEEKWEYKEPVVKAIPKPVAPQPVVQVPEVTREPSTGITCWPPRNPAGTGMVPKPESVKEEEAKIMEKWKVPEYPKSSEQQQQQQTVVVENYEQQPAVTSPTGTEGSTDGLKRKRVTSEQTSDDPPQSPPKPSSKKPFVPHVDANEEVPSLSPQTGQPLQALTNLAASSQQQDELQVVDERDDIYKKWKVDVNYNNTPVKPRLPTGNAPDFRRFQVHELNKQYEDLPILINEDTEMLDETVEASAERECSDKSAGRLGEQIIYRNLCELYKEDIAEGRTKVSWANEGAETGEPFDLKIEFEDQEPLYIEVKASYQDEQKRFEISSQQLRFAFEQLSRFHLYRVTGVSSSELKIKRLVNLSMYMDNKSVTLSMLL